MNKIVHSLCSLHLAAALLLLTPRYIYSMDTSSLDLSLPEAVEAALENNLGLQLRKEDVAFSEGTVEEARSSFDPVFSADVGATETNSNPVTIATPTEERSASWNAQLQKRFSPGTEVDLSWKNGSLDTDSDIYLFDPVYNTGVTLGLKQPLLKGRGSAVQLADVNSAMSTLEASSYLVDSEAADLAAEVKSAYWQLVYAHQNLEVLQLGLKLAVTLRDDTAAKIDAGKLASIDIFQPESEVARREEDLISGERAISFSEANLKLLMNSQDWLAPFNPVSRPKTDPLTFDLMEVFDNAMKNRPDLKAATMQIKASEFQVSKAENNILPALDLVGLVGVGGTDDSYGNAFERSFDDSDTEWQLGLMFSRPIDNSLAKGRLRQAKAQNRKNKTNLELLKQEIKRSIRVTVRDAELALKAIEATSKTALATQKRLEAEQIKFDAGRATTLDVLIAQQDYSNALSAENLAKVVYAQTLAELDRIQGYITLAN